MALGVALLIAVVVSLTEGGAGSGADGKVEYLVRWENYTPDDDSWEPRCNLLESEALEKYEQRVEAPNPEFQFLLFAAEPYETIGFKIPNKVRVG